MFAVCGIRTHASWAASAELYHYTRKPCGRLITSCTKCSLFLSISLLAVDGYDGRSIESYSIFFQNSNLLVWGVSTATPEGAKGTVVGLLIYWLIATPGPQNIQILAHASATR